LPDERHDKVHDYSRRYGVLHSEIMAPDNAPAWMLDRAKLWNAVEAIEKRKDSQLARDILIGLPHELNDAQRLDLVRGFVREVFVDQGMIADVSIHLPGKHGDERNHHAHIMLTFRSVTAEGFGLKAREWNDRDQLCAWRQRWAEHENAALAKAGFQVRVDHRSLEAQGLDLEPEPKVGPVATDMERNGKRSHAGDAVREVRKRNRRRREIGREIARIEKQISAIVEHGVEREKSMADETAAHDDAQAAQAQKTETERQAAAQQAEQDRQAQAAADQKTQLDKAGKEFADAEAAKLAAAAAEYNQRIERMAAQQRDRLQQQAQEMRAADEARAADLRTQQEQSKAYHVEQARIAQAAKQEAVAEAVDVRDPAARYAQALGRHYNITDPYQSLARAAMAEYGAFMDERGKLTQQIARAADPQERQALELRKRIEGLEYLAITGERIAQQSVVITGRQNSEEAVKQRQRAATCQEQARELRQQLKGLQGGREQEQAQQPERQPRPYRPRRPAANNQNQPQDKEEKLTPEQERERRIRLLREEASRPPKRERDRGLDNER